MCEYCPTTLDSTEYCFGIREICKPTPITHEIYDATALPANVYKAISAVHNSITGHHGLERTLWKLTNNNQKWKHMREDVRQFLNECPYCQKITQIKTPIITRRYTNHTYKPMQCINVDTIGPLPTDHKGYEYILVVIDCFTRFVTLHPVTDTAAESTVDALLSHIGTFGCPRYIKTDNGSQFVNETVKELVTIIGTEHVRTIAYSKEENGKVDSNEYQIRPNLAINEQDHSGTI